MSKIWKIIIGIVIAVVVVGLVGAGWFVASRGWLGRALAQRPAATRQVEVRLIDDNQDGVPDRGVIDLPARGAFNPGFGASRGRPFGRGFEPGRGRPFGLLFAPFFIAGGLIGGLISLAVLALLISLTVFLYRRWQPTPSAAPVAAPPAPTEAQSTPAAAPLENESTDD